jgi:uncharacterized Zn-binding protein involved in type VI secretion
MGKPAARIGDMTMHGGSIVVGCPTVLIGGMPAARLGDMHVCPMMTPGTPPIPHVGGPVSLGSTGVLIGGQPAARMGDMCVCVGPPDSVALGCMTVLIGEAGGGGGGGGGGGAASGASAANASAAVAQQGNLESTTKREHWVEFQFVDKAGLPVGGVQYKFADPGGKESEGVLKLDGIVRRDALPSGQCKLQLFSVSNARWSKKKAQVGEKVKMTANVEGYPVGTPVLFQLYRRDIGRPDFSVSTEETITQPGKAEAEWEYQYEDDTKNVRKGEKKWLNGYSAPEYYFEVLVGRNKARSDLLGYRDYLEIELRDKDDKPIPNVEYVLYLPNGEIRKGKLDHNGFARQNGVPPGRCNVRFLGTKAVL